MPDDNGLGLPEGGDPADSEGGDVLDAMDAVSGTGATSLDDTALPGQRPEAPKPEEPKHTWTDDLDDETREYVTKKGIKSAADLARSYREAEAQMHRSMREAEELRRQPAPEGPQAPQAPDAQSDFWGGWAGHVGPVMEAVDSGEVEPGKAMGWMVQQFAEAMRVRDNQWAEYAESRAREVVEPVQGKLRGGHFEKRIGHFREALGDDFADIQPMAAELIRQWTRVDPEYARNEHAVDAAFNQAITEHTLRQRAAARASTVNGNGQGPRGRKSDPAEDLLRAMDAAAPQGGGGGL